MFSHCTVIQNPRILKTMGESSVNGMIEGHYSPPRDEGSFMAESSKARSPVRPEELNFFLLDSNRDADRDVNVGEGPAPAVSREAPPTMDLLSGSLGGGNGSFSPSDADTSMNEVIMETNDLSVRESPPKKRRRACSCIHRRGDASDHLSALSDDLLHHIFSFLPTLDVVRTSALGRRWQRVWMDTWTNSRRLTFSLPSAMHGRLGEFSKIVDRSLNTDAPIKLQKLHICIPYDRSLKIKLNSWLKTAAERQVEDLSVDLIRETYKLPEALYCCSSVMIVSLQRCLFGSIEQIEWPILRVLMLDRVELTDDVMREIFRGSPALEFLKLFSCSGVENIEVDSRNMREMVIGYESVIGGDMGPHLLVNVSAPYLQVLRLVGDWTAKVVRLLDVSSLVEADLQFLENIHWFDTHSFGHQSSLLRDLLEELKHVDKIIIHHSCLQLVSIFEACGMSALSTRNKVLILNTKVDRWVIAGIAELLVSSIFLEKLVIDMTSSSISEFPVETMGIPSHDEEVYWVSGQKLQTLHCLNRCLKHVEIVSFDASCLGSKAVLALVKFLLCEAMVLEKMVINVEGSRAKDRAGPGDLGKLLEATHKIQSYPRGSESAELVFNYHLKGCSFSMDI